MHRGNAPQGALPPMHPHSADIPAHYRKAGQNAKPDRAETPQAGVKISFVLVMLRSGEANVHLPGGNG